MLGPLDGATVLDLFAGTGALGIEALSRGAERAVFVERDPGVMRVLESNLTALDLASPRAQARCADVLAALRSARGREETYDLIFIDPPYAQADEAGAELAAVLPPLLGRGARIVVESDRRAPMDLPLAGTGGLDVETQRSYGDTLIKIHRHA
jgi:16S rRNA (guanine966-N2)-methyltransferase